ncbi:hypothetical protein [Priestia flexa]|nr:hypothetical protein [Priestia flexa]
MKEKLVAVYCPVCKTPNAIFLENGKVNTKEIKCYKCNCIANKKMWGVIA